MRRFAFIVTLAALFVGPLPAEAQSDAPRVYSAYFKVDFPDIPAWIENYQTTEVPIFDALVEEGVLTDYGLWVHDTGGEYNLQMNMIAPSWDALGDFWDAYFERLPPEVMAEGSAMIRKHTDEIWTIATPPAEGGAGGAFIYESAWHIAYDQLEAYDEDFEQYAAPILEQAVADGLITGWAKLGHDTGGPWNVKLLYWMDSWDNADDLIARLGEGREGMDPEAMRSARAHEDHVWRSVPRTPGM